MPPASALISLETERLVLRRQEVDDAAVFRHLWTERDARVPQHRQLTPEGRPTLNDIATQIRESPESTRPGLLAVGRKGTADVIGYCGLVFNGNGVSEEPELAFELLRAVHNRGYATEAGRAVVTWARNAGYQRLWATVWEWNIASLRVLEKLGFSRTGRVTAEGVHGRSLLTVKTLSTASGNDHAVQP